ncbi:spermidine/putrescine ABC transporter substrate-binding protein [Peterkaempfera bronchialis]|uniref:Spermidine/putrescine ABC transporter substrate-binding protein n=2 Tax=Peterkaempfera bronchialis TaxID=2126346 RepID=A0A345T6J5_9ACTN|nr:spermidine/putrescine ABC transporter substrate-binding protein [Peterkaempfera bronchialis]
MLASCGSSGSSGSKLRAYSWSAYDDPKVLSAFTKKYGPKVVVDSYSSNEEMIAKLVAAKGTSGYDIVIPTGVFVPQMAANGLLQELDHSKLPNLANLGKGYQNQEWDRGNKYTVTKYWGTTGFVYDTRVIKRDLKTWDDFFDAAMHEASGKTSLVDDPGEICAMLCFARGWHQSTTDKAQLDQIESFLIDKLAPHIAAFDSSPGSSAIPQGTHALMHCWNGDARRGILASSEQDRWKWVLPGPKTNLWMDNWAIVKGSPNADAAHELIDYVLDPAVAIKQVEFVGYGTGVNGTEEEAKRLKLELIDMISPSAEQLATMYTGVINKGQERRMAIVNRMKAEAGA